MSTTMSMTPMKLQIEKEFKEKAVAAYSMSLVMAGNRKLHPQRMPSFTAALEDYEPTFRGALIGQLSKQNGNAFTLSLPMWYYYHTPTGSEEEDWLKKYKNGTNARQYLDDLCEKHNMILHCVYTQLHSCGRRHKQLCMSIYVSPKK